MRVHLSQVPAATGISAFRLVLSLALSAMAAIISIHYYLVANDSRQANMLLSQIFAITSIADNLASTSSTYTGVVTTNSVQSLLPSDGMVTPWGTSMAITSATYATYTVIIPLTPARVCKMLKKRLHDNGHINMDETHCPPSGSVTFIYTYQST